MPFPLQEPLIPMPSDGAGKASARIAAVLGTVIAVLAASSAGGMPAAQAADDVIRDGFNAPVLHTVSHAGTTYAVGTFTAWGPQTGGGALVDADWGLLDRDFAAFDNDVLTSVSDGAGGLFAAGYFHIAGTHRTGIAHILADGTVDSGFTAFTDGGIQALALADGVLYAGGEFECIGRTQLPTGLCTEVGEESPRANLVAFDASDGDVLAWDPASNGPVNALAVRGTSVFVGGDFDRIGTNAANRDRLAEIDSTTGAASSWDPGPNSDVTTLVVDSSTLFVGGYFTTIGSARSRIAAFDLATSGIPLTSWDPSADGPVAALAVDAGTVYVGGNFANVGGAARGRLAAVDAASGVAAAWSADADGPVADLAVIGASVYVGGDFQTIGSSPAARRGAAAVSTAAGAAVLGWNPNPNPDGHPMTIRALGSEVFVGGGFTTVNDWQARSFTAAVDANGALTSWAPSIAGNSVASSLIVGDRLYILGNFSHVDSAARNDLAAFDLSTGGVTSWDPDPSPGSELTTFTASGSTIYVSGTFTRMGGLLRPGLAAVDATTGVATPWIPATPDGNVEDIVVSGSRVYIAGGFTMIGADTHHLIAALDVDTAATLPWDPQLDGWVLSQIALVGSTVVFGGRVTCMVTHTYGGPCTTAGEVPLDGMGGADAVTGAPVAGWIHELNSGPDAQGYPRSFVTHSGTTYLGGEFDSLDGQQAGNLAAFTSTGEVIPGWAPTADDSVWSLDLVGSSLVTAGGYRRLEGVTPSFLGELSPYAPPAPMPDGGGTNSTPSPAAPAATSPAAAPDATPSAVAPAGAGPATTLRRIGGGVTVVSGAAAQRAKVTWSCQAPNRTLDSAPTTNARVGTIVRLRTRGMPRSTELAVRMLIGRSWVFMGKAHSNDSGAATLPAFTTARAGAYPIRLASGAGRHAYLVVETSRAGRMGCPVGAGVQ